MTRQPRRCPMCGTLEKERVFALDELIVVRCRSCGLIFRDTCLDDDASKALYAEAYFTKEQADYFFNFPKEKEILFRERLKMVQRYVPLRGKLLDIGCAIGTFLKVAQDDGYAVQGVEISAYAAQFARKTYGLDVRCAMFDRSTFPGQEKFDVITMWDVIDHSEEPVAFLRNAASLLKENGTIFVETTMEDSLVYELCAWLYRLSFGLIKGPVAKGHPVHHSVFFSRATLRNALVSCGLTVKAVEPSDYPAQFFPGGKLVKSLFGLVYRIGNMIGMPLIVTFVAHKKGAGTS